MRLSHYRQHFRGPADCSSRTAYRTGQDRDRDIDGHSEDSTVFDSVKSLTPVSVSLHKPLKLFINCILPLHSGKRDFVPLIYFNNRLSTTNQVGSQQSGYQGTQHSHLFTRRGACSRRRGEKLDCMIHNAPSERGTCFCTFYLLVMRSPTDDFPLARSIMPNFSTIKGQWNGQRKYSNLNASHCAESSGIALALDPRHCRVDDWKADNVLQTIDQQQGLGRY